MTDSGAMLAGSDPLATRRSASGKARVAARLALYCSAVGLPLCCLPLVCLLAANAAWYSTLVSEPWGGKVESVVVVAAVAGGGLAVIGFILGGMVFAWSIWKRESSPAALLALLLGMLGLVAIVAAFVSSAVFAGLLFMSNPPAPPG